MNDQSELSPTQLANENRRLQENIRYFIDETNQLKEKVSKLNEEVERLENPDKYNREWVRKSLYRSLQDSRKRSILKGMKFSLTSDDIDALLEKNPDRCTISGIKFKRRQDKHSRNPHAPSIDRIDNSKGYIKGNVRIVAYCINNAMNEWGEDIIKEIATSYYEWNTHI